MTIYRNVTRLAAMVRRTTASSCAYAATLGILLLASGASRADDIDIYTKALSSGVSGSPTLVFQVDNSGSMMWRLSQAGSTNASDLLDQRLYRMADVAMAQVTGMRSTFRLGITSYEGNSTGALRSPALALDETFLSATTTGGTSTFPLVDENDDAWQDYGSTTPVVHGNTLAIGTPSAHAAIDVTLPYASGWPATYPAAAAAFSELGLATPTGSAGTAGSLMAGIGGNVVIWYRHGSSTNTQVFKVTGATANTFLTLTDANGTVLASTSTKSEASGGDCSTVVTSGNNACLSRSLSRNTTYRLVIGTDAANATGAFSFDLGYPTRKASSGGVQVETMPPLPRRAGLRFQRVDIPRGATITSAWIEFKSAEDNAGQAQWRAGFDQADTPASLHASLFGRSAYWSTPTTLGDWSSDTVNNATRLTVTSALQARINQADWCGGELVALVDAIPVSGIVPLRTAHAYEGLWTDKNAQESRLVVRWTASGAAPAGSDCRTRTVTVAAHNVSDDVQQDADGTIVFDGKRGATTSTSLYLSATRKAGLRFPLVPLPPGTRVTDARLELVPAAGATQSLRVKVVDGDNAAAFAGTASALDALEFARAAGSESIGWTPAAWSAGAAIQSPNIAPLVQAVLDREGWRYDNALAIVLEGSAGSESAFRAWEYNDAGTPNTDRARYGVSAARLVLTVSNDSPLPVQQTHRWRSSAVMNAMPAVNSTPIMGAYIESAQYLLGWDNFDDAMPKLSSGDCATNGIVILTDGEESSTYTSTQSNASAAISGKTCSTSRTSGKWQCLYDMTAAMYNKRNTHDDNGKYSIRTDAIGFGPEASSSVGLAGIEGKGGGKFYLASDSAALTNAFRDIIATMSISTASVAAAGVAVNALNRFEHLDQLYYSLFSPSTTIDWSGNMKRYRLKNSELLDVSNTPAVEIDASGFFKADARSYWSSLVDGSNVSVGGAAGKTPATARNLYTKLPGKTLAAAPDEITADNDDISAALLGITDLPYYLQAGGPLATTTQVSARRTAVIDFLRAAPVSDSSQRWGAAIHNTPRVVTFDPSRPGGPAPVVTVFYADNRGLLHAIDAGGPSSDTAADNLANTGGGELWSFVPHQLLKNAAFFHDNTEKIATDGYRYGFDGDITIHREPASGVATRVLLFAGMRRGGSNYYGFDVTTSNTGVTTAGNRKPKLKWVIEGGTGDFAEMGQSWSTMVRASVRIGSQVKPLLAFGGGYDPAFHDDGDFNNTTGTGFTDAPQKGRAFYLVDMETGELVWKSTELDAGKFPAIARMKYSIVATPRVLDRNADGLADAAYVVDLAGQVFRFEFAPNAANADSLVSDVVLVAQLGATTPLADADADNRRFFESPSVARSGSDIVLGLSSGYREEPRSRVTEEAFFFVRDTNAFKSGQTSNAMLTTDMLDDITGTPDQAIADPTKPGWMLRFNQALAEKGIGSPVIFNYGILFATWRSENADLACTPDVGSTGLYFVNFKGQGLVKDGTDADDAPDRFLDIDLPGLGDTPQVLFQTDGLAVAVGVRILDAEDDLCADGVNCPLANGGWAEWQRARWRAITPD